MIHKFSARKTNNLWGENEYTVFWNYSVVMRLIFLSIVTYTIYYVFLYLRQNFFEFNFLFDYFYLIVVRQGNIIAFEWKKSLMLSVLNTGVTIIYYRSINNLYASTNIVSEQSRIFRNIFSQSFLLTSSFRIHRQTHKHKLSKSFNMLILDKTDVLSAFFRKIKYCIGNLIIKNLQAWLVLSKILKSMIA